MIIPDAERSKYFDNMLGGLVMHLAGPPLLKLGFHIFVVVRWCSHLGGSRQHLADRRERRHEPRGGRWRASRLVPPSA